MKFTLWTKVTFAVACTLAVALLLTAGAAPAKAGRYAITFTYTPMDFPGSTATTASGINNGQVIVGDYIDTNKVMHGYLHSPGGTWVPVDYPGATATSLWAINDNNQAVGYYIDGTGNYHGFLYVLPGIYQAINYPNASFTIAYGINNSLQIVGTWIDSSGVHQNGFSLINSIYTNLTYPSAATTIASGVNSFGNICGVWYDSHSVAHGFTLNMAINGSYNDFESPGAAQTGADKINDKLQIGGYVADANNNLSGLYSVPALNQYVFVRAPTSVATIVRGINNQPIIVGHFTDAGGRRHGFSAVQSAD